MIKIAIHEPMPMGAVSFYRSIGVLSYLYKLNHHIQTIIPPSISWNSLSGIDILYMERPQQDSDLRALHLAKDFNVKIWVDYDDLLHAIPKYNPAYNFYTKTKALKNVEEALQLADIVTVSTQKIKDFYLKYNKNIHVIENAHNDYKYKFKKILQTKDIINWRGSNTHRQDLLSVSANMFKISENHPKWVWNLIGNEVWYIVEKLKNSHNIGECDIIEYNKFIRDITPAIQIVPLLFSEFNSAKSNIGWLEGTATGSATVAPLLPEFDKPGVINYTEKEDSFGYHLEKAMSDIKFRQKKYIESFEYITDNLLLSKVNFKRLDIIERLMSC